MSTLQSLIRLEEEIIGVDHQLFCCILQLVQFAVELNRRRLAGEGAWLVRVWMVDIIEEAIVHFVPLLVERLDRVPENC